MESVIENKISFPHNCEFCGNAGISKCGRCSAVYYCCQEHQYLHWPMHKKACKEASNVPLSVIENQSTSSNILPSPDIKRDNPNETEKRSPGKSNEEEGRSPNNRNVAEISTMETLAVACNNFIRDMGTLGIYVVDNFMGSENGNLILKEVKILYENTLAWKERVIRQSSTISLEISPSSIMMWFANPDPKYPNIGALIQKINYLVYTCSNMPNGGLLSRHRLTRRSRIMLTIQLGKGMYYERHVDNPNKDGRCITSVYYLNHNWDNHQGGVLRTYPCFSSQCHDFEPIFDRLVMFWSNERVPYEVTPVFATRFAITVWYLDQDELEESLRRKKRPAEGAQNS